MQKYVNIYDMTTRDAHVFNPGGARDRLNSNPYRILFTGRKSKQNVEKVFQIYWQDIKKKFSTDNEDKFPSIALK